MGAAAVVGWIVMVTVDFLVSVTGTISLTFVVTVAYCGMIYMSFGVYERWQRRCRLTSVLVTVLV